MIHRRGAESAERTDKNLCELGVSAVNSTGKVNSVSQPGSRHEILRAQPHPQQRITAAIIVNDDEIGHSRL